MGSPEMSENSKIEWTHHTFNPWHGCAKVSPACDHCYAERDSKRFNGDKVLWGVDAERLTLSESYWKQPIKWNKRAGENGVRERVFCASMADVFDKNAPEGARERLWKLIKDTPHLDWLLLTKRIGNAKTMLPSDWGKGYENVWLVISICNQVEADRDIPKLLDTPAVIRGLSMEPLLGHVKLPRVDFHCDLCGGTGILGRWPRGKCHHCNGKGNLPAISTDPQFGVGSTPMRFIDWVIVGGESGNEARPMHPAWARSLRDQCAAAGVPFFFKQWGEWEIETPKAGGDLGGDLRKGVVKHLCYGRENDGHFRKGDAYMRWVGKKNAGRLLDGVTHDGYPEVQR